MQPSFRAAGTGAWGGLREGDFGVWPVHSGQNQTQAGFSSPLSISLAPWLLLKQGYSATELVPKNIIHIPLRGFSPAFQGTQKPRLVSGCDTRKDAETQACSCTRTHTLAHTFARSLARMHAQYTASLKHPGLVMYRYLQNVSCSLSHLHSSLTNGNASR